MSILADDDDAPLLRRTVYALLIITALATMTGRILSARSTDRHTPFFSANDRSRWSTISALVDNGFYEIDWVRKRPGWQSIDMVRHEGRDGKQHYYSSKPPLFPTMLAGQYWLIKTLTGATFDEHPFAVARTMLILTNVLPMGLFLVLIAAWAEQQGETDFGRMFVVAAACWATYLLPFSITLNNHTPAAISTLVCMLVIMRIWAEETPAAWLFVVAGLAAGFAAANELPALSFSALATATLLWLAPGRTLRFFLPAAAVVVIAFFATTYIAHASWRPPYAHRNPGDNWYDYPGSYWYGSRQGVDLGEPSKAKYLFHMLIGHHGFFSLTPIMLISLCGVLAGLRNSDPRIRYLCGATLLLFVVCVTYYTGLRPQRDRNYGGVTSGFRWLFWQIPLWLMAMVPAADWLSETRPRRIIAIALLAFSAISVAIPATNPWTHPWMFGG